MTPERKAYLAKCGRLERKYRLWIKLSKERIKEAKANIAQRGDIYWEKDVLRSQKLYLSWYRHELNRLKGMNNVVVPRGVIIPPNTDLKQGYCICGRDVYDALDSYCPKCGRRILWERAK